LEQAEHLAPEDGEVAFQMAKVLRALGEPERAAVYLKRYEATQAHTLGPKTVP